MESVGSRPHPLLLSCFSQRDALHTGHPFFLGLTGLLEPVSLRLRSVQALTVLVWLGGDTGHSA